MAASANRAFLSLVASQRPPDWQPPPTLLALDPGETTGWAVFSDGLLSDCGQIRTNEENLITLFDLTNPDTLVYELFRLYGDKAMSLVGSEMTTSEFIGMVRMLCYQRGITYCKQGAGDVKGFMTDHFLRKWYFYQSDKRHANDAIRHAAFALCRAPALGPLRSTTPRPAAAQTQGTTSYAA